jgi:hypothetical protein
MGAEAKVTARIDGEDRPGILQLEQDLLIFKGDGYRLKLSAQPGSVSLDGEWLCAGNARFQLGNAAAKWLDKIENPKGRIDKAGIRPGDRVCVLGKVDEAFVDELTQRLGAKPKNQLSGEFDWVVLCAETSSDLSRLEGLRPYIAAKGAVWVVYPKGVQRITQQQVLNNLRASGFVDTKVMSFSESHTALKGVLSDKHVHLREHEAAS